MCLDFKVHAKLLMQGKSGADEGEGMEADAAAGGGGGGGADTGGGGGTNAVALELLPFPQINVVDFGSIHINERAARKVRIAIYLARHTYDFAVPFKPSHEGKKCPAE